MTYTPTTEDVRREYAGEPCLCGCYDDSFFAAEAAFDRWLEAHDREVKAQALEEAAELAEGQDGFEIEIGLANYIGSELRHRTQQLKEQK